MAEERSEHGLKTAAGLRLSKLIRQIGSEQTEPLVGEGRMMTKFEALARTVWKMALGWEEEGRVKDEKTGKQSIVTKQHKPDMACIQLIYDRLEGKVATNAETGKKKRPMSEKIGEQAKKRLNAMVGGGDDGGPA